MTARADPARERIVEGVRTIRKHQKATRDDFANADSFTGFTHDANGGVRLTSSGTTSLSKLTTGTSEITDLNRASPFLVASLRWAGSLPDDVEITRVTLRLDPAYGGAKNVDIWRLQLMQVIGIANADPSGDSDYLELAPLGAHIDVTAVGTAGNVNFTSAAGSAPQPKRLGRPRNGGEISDYRYPLVLIFLTALQSDGSAATNVAWRYDNASNYTQNNITLDLWDLRQGVGEPEGTFERFDTLAAAPWTEIQTGGGYSNTTITWSTTSPRNTLDLGATPTETVEFFAEFALPVGTDIDLEVRNDADTAWVAFQDGDTTDDLAGVGKRQYYAIRAILYTNAAFTLTPILRAIGVAELEVVDVTDVCTLRGGGRSVDPVTLQSSVAELTIQALRDGIPDFRSAITELIKDTHLVDLGFRVFWGHRTLLTRDQWLPYDVYFVDDYEMGAGSDIVLTCVSALSLIRQTIPRYDDTGNTEAPYELDNQTLKASFESIRDTVIELQTRYHGPGIENTTDTVSVIVRDTDRGDAKEHLEAVAFIDGRALITSRGRLTAVDMHGDKPTWTIIEEDEIRTMTFTPGYRVRAPELFTEYNWSDNERRYKGKIRSYNQTALDNLGIGRIDAKNAMPDVVQRYLDTQALAETLAARQVQRFGTGQITIGFETTYELPHIEQGDALLIPTRRLVAHDPIADRALAGQLWVFGVVVETRIDARGFAVWVRDWADVLGTDVVGDVTSFGEDWRCSVYHSTTQSLGPNVTTALSFNSESEDTTGTMHDTVTNNSRITAPGRGKYHARFQAAYEITTPWGAPTVWNVFIRQNGTTTLDVVQKDSASGAGQPTEDVIEVNWTGVLDIDDYVEAVVTTGGTTGGIDMKGGSTGAHCRFELTRLNR